MRVARNSDELLNLCREHRKYIVCQGSFTTETRLDLAGMKLCDEGTICLSHALKSLKNLDWLCLKDNGIREEGMIELAQVLEELNFLKHLDLCTDHAPMNLNSVGTGGIFSRNSINLLSARALARSFGSLTSLQHLDLQNTDLDSDGISALSSALAKLCSLQHLNLRQNELGSEGTRQLAPALTGLKSLRHLDLSKNDIGGEGVRSLGRVLMNLNSLQHLGLGVNKIGTDGARALARCLTKKRNLQDLRLNSNDLGAEGILVLVPAFLDMCSLQKLFLGGNKLGVSGARHLAPVLSALTSLQEVNLNENSLGVFNGLGLSSMILSASGRPDLKIVGVSNFDFLAVKEEFMTPLLWACSTGNAFFTECMLKSGAPPRVKNRFGHDAAYYARASTHVGSIQCLRLLQERGVELDAAQAALDKQAVKVVLVGEPEAGKSTLVRRFRSYLTRGDGRDPNAGDDVATPGIDVSNFPMSSSVALSFFDFGGQETLYPTHQLFLTSNSVFVVVVDLSLDDQSLLPYWAEQVLRHGSLPTAYLVGTHADHFPYSYPRRCYLKAEERMKKLRAILVGVGMTLDADHCFILGREDNKRKVEQIFSGIMAAAKSIQKHRVVATNTAVLELYLHVKQESERRRAVPEALMWIEWGKFEEWMRRFGVENELRCAEFLVERGVIMTLKHAAATLAPDLVVLDPAWLADIFSTVVSIDPAGSLHKYVGFVKREYLHDLWAQKGYAESTFPRIESLLIMYQLMQPVQHRSADGKEQFFVPSMAWRPKEVPRPSEEQLGWEWPPLSKSSQQEFGRRLELDFIPTGFLQNVLGRLCELKGVEIVPEVIQRKDYILRRAGQSSHIRLVEDEKQRSVTLLFRCDPAEGAVLPVFFHLLFSSLELNLGRYHIKPTVRRFVVLYNGKELGEVSSIRSTLLTVRGGDPVLERLAPDLLLPGVSRFLANDLVLGGKLAEGGFGLVYKAKTGNETEVVVKVPKKDDGTSTFLYEGLLMHMLGSSVPSLNRLLGLYIDPEHERLGLVLDYVKRPDLFKFLSREGHPDVGKKYREADAPLWAALQRPSFKMHAARDIAAAMAHMHSGVHPSPVIHSDLRSANIFLNSHDEAGSAPVAVVGDVGGALLASVSRKPQMNSAELAPEMCFTAMWTGFGQSADVYCFGLILWQLLTLEYPPDLGWRILDGERPPLDPSWLEDPATAKLVEVMERCWMTKPEERLCFGCILLELDYS